MVDTGAETFDLYVDGVRMEHGVPLRAPTSSVDEVRFYVDGTGAGIFARSATSRTTQRCRPSSSTHAVS